MFDRTARRADEAPNRSRNSRKRHPNSIFPGAGLDRESGIWNGGGRSDEHERGVVRLVSDLLRVVFQSRSRFSVHRERRRRWTPADKLRDCGGGVSPGAVAKRVAERHEIGTGLLFTWRRQLRENAGTHFLAVQLTEAPEGCGAISRNGRPAQRD